MNTKHILTILTALTALLVAPLGTTHAQARTFEVREDGGSRAQFTSDAPLETITGVTSHVFGEFTGDPTQLASMRGTIDVRTSTIRTGIDLRDEHLRSDTWLDAGAFPTIRFELASVSGATSVAPNAPTRVTLHGRLTLHGRTREVQAPGRATWIPAATGTGGTMRVTAHFGLRLRDYGISIPTIVELKVSNDIGIDVSLRGIVRGGA